MVRASYVDPYTAILLVGVIIPRLCGFSGCALDMTQVGTRLGRWKCYLAHTYSVLRTVPSPGGRYGLEIYI